MIGLDGRRALVCGSSRGIGRACAGKLAERGAAVTLVARDEAGLRSVLATLPTPDGQRHDLVVADFCDPEGLRRQIEAHLQRVGPVSILVNNTGGPPPGPILDATPDDFTRAMTMHLLCNHVLVQLVAPGMKEQRWGRIINIISTSVRQPIPGLGVSNTVRAAVASWAKTLAGELAPFGITVNNVLPGYTETERLRSLIGVRARNAGVAPEQIERTMRGEIPMGRFADPAEIAAVVAFLASPEASYVSGVSLPVDGGRTSAL